MPKELHREVDNQFENKIGELLFNAFAKSKAPRKNWISRLREFESLKERPILYKNSLSMWERLRYEVEEEQPFERRPLYLYNVQRYHGGVLRRIDQWSHKSAMPIPGGDVIEERGDDPMFKPLDAMKPKELEELFDHLHDVELQKVPLDDYDFLLEPLEAGIPDPVRDEAQEEEEEEDKMANEEIDTKMLKTNEAMPPMSKEDAKKILEAKQAEEGGEDALDMEHLEKQYKALFALNDPGKGGSLYLALKIQAAYDVLTGRDLVKKDQAKKKDERVDKMKSEHKKRKSEFNPNLKKVRIPNPMYLPDRLVDMTPEERKLAESVLANLKERTEYRQQMYSKGRRRDPQKDIPDVFQNDY